MMNRRSFLVATGSVSCGSSAIELVPASQQKYRDLEAADKWMSKWMAGATTKGSVGMLYIGRFADPTYFTLSPIGWSPEGEQVTRYNAVQVPTGFVTDFASIPRVFWSILRPDGVYSYAAVIHDYLYWEQSIPRKTADEVLKMCMEDFRIDKLTIDAIFNAVRRGGASAWDENAKLKAGGERRQLKLTPKDPTIRWADWKTNPDVF